MGRPLTRGFFVLLCACGSGHFVARPAADAGIDARARDAAPDAGDAGPDAGGDTVDARTEWATVVFEGTGLAIVEDIAIAPDDSIWLTGMLNGKGDLGDGPLCGHGIDDLWVAHFDDTGDPLDSACFGGSENDVGQGVAVDAEGNVYVAGVSYDDAIDFGGGPLDPSGQGEIVLASFDTVLGYRWAMRLGDRFYDNAFDVAVGGDVVAITGHAAIGADLGSGPIGDPGGVFFARFDRDGVPLGGAAFGSSIGPGVASDGTDFALSIDHTGPVDFGEGTYYPRGSMDALVAGLTADGAERWAEGLGAGGSDVGGRVAMDPAGDTCIAGSFEGTVDFGSGSTETAGARDGFYACFDRDGRPLESRALGGAGDDEAFAIAMDADGNVYVTGAVVGSADFGGGVRAAGGDREAFVASYAPDGTHRWSRVWGNGSPDRATAVAVDSVGRVYVAVLLSGAADLGDGLVGDPRRGNAVVVQLVQ